MIATREKLGPVLSRMRRELMTRGDESSVRLAKTLMQYETRILREIRRHGENGVTRSDLNRVTATINRIILESDADLAAYLRDELPAGALNGLKTQAEMLKASFGADRWEDLPSERIKAIFGNFETSIRTRTILPTNDAQLMARWAGEWDDRWAEITRGLQTSFIEAAANGDSWLKLAERVTDDIGGLGINGQQNADAFARGFTRAKLTEIANAASTRSASMAGITKFVNIGVPDDRQSDECAAASQYEAMTIEEWQASGEGPPPRHVLNCRCLLSGVPVELEETVEQYQEAIA